MVNIHPGFFVPANRAPHAWWPQAPAQPQPPLRTAGHAGALMQSPQPLGVAADGAKVENCLLIFAAPQEGHFPGVSDRVRARCSKAWPQSEQTYS